MHTPPAAVIVMAAGKGTRMKSDLPKVLHPIGGRSLLGHAVEAVRGLHPDHVVVVVGHGREAVIEHLAAVAPDVTTAVQEQQNGTGHAVMAALTTLPGLTGTVVVTSGDVPLQETSTLRDLVAVHEAAGAAVTALTAVLPDAGSYGRIVRAADGQVEAIVEAKDATPEQLAIREINAGIYAFDAAVLSSALSRVTSDNAQGELYLTDVLAIARGDGCVTAAHQIADVWQTEGANDRAQLADLGRELNRRVTRAWMRSGVTIVDPETTWIDVQVELEPDCLILPSTQLHGRTRVAGGATVGPDSTLTDVDVQAGATVTRTHGSGAVIGPNATVGPFTYLRPGTVLGTKSKAGAFVELKASVVGEGSKVPHLSYVGDAMIGRDTNIGAASVFVNYDGQNKHRTVVGDHVRVGSDTMLVAPVTIGDGAYTAAGSVITEDVPPGALAVGRARQHTSLGWVAKRRAGSTSAAAAAAAVTEAIESGSSNE